MGNTFKLGGQQPVDIDMKQFKAKSMYKPANDFQIKRILSEEQALQNELKKYKYYKDLDRISYNANHQDQVPNTWQYQLEKNIIAGIFLGALFSRITAFQTARSYFSVALWLRKLPGTILTFVVMFVGFGLFREEFQPQNWNRHQGPQMDVRAYMNLDYHLDVYKYAQKSKHNYKYTTSSQRKQVSKQIQSQRTKFMQETAHRYFRQKYSQNNKQQIL